ncbi:MAG: rod shape-determining protein MreC [Dysgonamonadaceae bacterium]|jgi:rod shape-determining protein MreC|nr:rod shape-determining protein MreC [Dysgonamonadaceae bacterium]
MKALFYFIIRNLHWLLAILLVAFSFYLVFSHNSYQRSVFLSSSNIVVGNVYKASNYVNSFFHLRRNNSQLLERNAELEMKLLALMSHLEEVSRKDSVEVRAFVRDSLANELFQFSFMPAEVANLTFAGSNNFITLNRGSLHGIRSGMGVISQTGGIVGVVSTVSSRFSVVLPVINPNFRVSAKLSHSENFGLISWNGKNVREAQLTELPRHEVFQRGDTVLTSFSRIFPRNLIIGFVSEQGQRRDDNFNIFNVRLATNFYTLRDVLVIDDRFYQEQNELEQSFLR